MIIEVLLTVLKVVAIVLLAIILLLILATFLLRLWLVFDYTPKKLLVQVGAGPYHWTLYRKNFEQKKQQQKTQDQKRSPKQEEPKPPGTPPEKPPDLSSENPPERQNPQTETPPKTAVEQKKNAEVKTGQTEKPTPKPQEEKAKQTGKKTQNTQPKQPQNREEKKFRLQIAFEDRLNKAREMFGEDPIGFIRTVWEYVRWLDVRLLQGLEIRGLEIIWAIHGKEAADTALLYANIMNLANMILSYLRSKIEISAKKLWLIPDYTDEEHNKRRVKFYAETYLYKILGITLSLAWKFWKDPNFKPQKNEGNGRATDRDAAGTDRNNNIHTK